MLDPDLLKELPINDCPTESDWYRSWLAVVGQAGSMPADLAVLGGSTADRFAWVFMSGYQAAVRCCFPEFAGDGWICFAAAEPKDDPGCVVETDEDCLQLLGQKSWIAGAEHVNRLVVTVTENSAVRYLFVQREAPGVSITLPRTPSFLAELSQGAAAFDRVSIAPEQILEDPLRAPRFRAAEPLFVLLALNGCLANHARVQTRGNVQADSDQPDVVQAALRAIEYGYPLPAELADRTVIKPALAELRALTAKTVALFEQQMLPGAGKTLQQSWSTDSRLLQMFGVHG